MKLDEGLEYKTATLDITPLIDIAFLLLLFFAVTTSFISPEDLKDLSRRLTALTTVNETLVATDDLRKEDLEDLSRQLTALTTANETLAATDDRRKEDLENLSRRLTALTTVSEDLSAEVDRRQEEIAALGKDLTQRNRTLTLLQGRLDATMNALAVAAGEAEDMARRFDETQRAIQEERTRSGEAIGRLTARNAVLAQGIENLQSELARALERIAGYRARFDANRAQTERMIGAAQAISGSLNALLLDNTLTIERIQNQLTIYLSEKVLFDSGSADIKPQGVPLMRTVGEGLKQNIADLRIQVGGHTDDVPIRGRYASNWELSAARAASVVRFFESQVGIDPVVLSAAGFGEHHPLASNDTAEGRARNRRIELILLPKPTDLDLDDDIQAQPPGGDQQ
jgi:chemotaxis protein MotB